MSPGWKDEWSIFTPYTAGYPNDMERSHIPIPKKRYFGVDDFPAFSLFGGIRFLVSWSCLEAQNPQNHRGSYDSSLVTKNQPQPKKRGKMFFQKNFWTVRWWSTTQAAGKGFLTPRSLCGQFFSLNMIL